jgi:ribosomal protein S27E
MYSKEFIKTLVDSCPAFTAEGISEHISSELKLIEEIRTALKCYKASLTDEHRRHELKRKELDEQFLKVRQKCKHWQTTFHPDPSGNNDSYYECTICGLGL